MTSIMSRHTFRAVCLLLGLLWAAVDGLSLHNDDSPPTPMNIIVIGGSSGMGKAAAIACVKRGGKALIVSRSKEKLERAAKEICSNAPSEISSNLGENNLIVETAVLDATDEDAVKKFVEEKLMPPLHSSSDGHNPTSWDGLVISAAGKAPHGPVADLPTESTRQLFESKFWSAYHCAKHIGPMLSAGGGIIFVAGVLNRRPGMNCAPLASTNGALEGLTRALALELGPNLRVNCLR